MATVAEIQAQLDSQGTAKILNILKKEVVTATLDNFYIVGMNGYAGKNRWVQTTSTDTAAQQATAIVSGMA